MSITIKRTFGDPGGGKGRALLAHLLDPVADPERCPQARHDRDGHRETDQRRIAGNPRRLRSMSGTSRTATPSATTNQARL